jgi:hypothetical protein
MPIHPVNPASPETLGGGCIDGGVDNMKTEEQLATLLRLTERYCVVYQTLSHTPELSVS